jgi:hypothetical protein
VVTRGLLGDKEEGTNLQHDGLTIAVQTIVSTEKICQTLNVRARPRDYLYTGRSRGHLQEPHHCPIALDSRCPVPFPWCRRSTSEHLLVLRKMGT